MKRDCKKPVRLSIASTAAHLPVVRAALEKMCEAVGFDSEAAGRIVLSTDEALTNIIKHAYQGADDRPIDIELAPISDEPLRGLRITIRDYGRWVDRSLIRSRDLSDVRPGGLGVHIMTHCMDELEYRPADGGGTVLTMVKQIRSRRKETKT